MIYFDEEYVRDILKELPKGLTGSQFLERTQNDYNQGWGHEVNEARRRYFANNPALQG